MKKSIDVGTAVEFDTPYGPLRGVVADIKQNIGNGQRIATVQVKGMLADAPCRVPVNELQAIAA